MEYYFSAFKKKKFYHATTQMNFEDLMLSVCFQLTNQIPCFISAFRLYKFTPRNCQKNLIFSEETDISIILEHSSPFQPQAIVRGQKTLVSCLQVQCIMLNLFKLSLLCKDGVLAPTKGKISILITNLHHRAQRRSVYNLDSYWIVWRTWLLGGGLIEKGRFVCHLNFLSLNQYLPQF